MSQLMGTVLGAGRYRIDKLLGSGGQGIVYRGTHLALNIPVAIKVLSVSGAREKATEIRFKREAQRAAALDHPNIVTVYDYAFEAGMYYIVNAFIEGTNLEILLKANPGPLPMEQVLTFARQVGDALQYAHDRNIIHRDIKPSNILIDGSDGRAVLCDFGLARMMESEELSVTSERGGMPGTPAYMSPEQCLGTKLDQHTDIYSLGIVIYEMVTGQNPFRGPHDTTASIIYKQVNRAPPSPRSINPSVTRQLEAVLLKALAKDPKQRFQSASEFVKALEEACRVAPGARIARARPRRRPIPAWLPLVLAGAMVIVVIAFLPQSRALFRNLLAKSESTPANTVSLVRTATVAPTSQEVAALTLTADKVSAWTEAPVSETPVGEAPANTSTPRRPLPDGSASQVTEVARLGGGFIYQMALSPNGKTLALGGSVGIWLYNAEDLEATPRLLEGHTEVVISVAYSPDAATLASGDWNGTVRVWDVASGKLLYVLESEAPVKSLVYSPDGATLAGGCDDHAVRLWDANSGELLRVMRGHGGQVDTVTYSPDGTMLASGSQDGRVRLWNAATGEAVTVLEGHTDLVASLAYSPDGGTLVSGSWDDTLRLWNVATGEILAVLEGHEDWVNSVAYSPDGATVASGSDDSTVRVWDVRTGQVLSVVEGHTEAVRSVAYSSDGATLISTGEDGAVVLSDVGTGRTLRALKGRVDGSRSVNYSPDGTTLASATWNDTVWVRDAATGQVLRVLEGHTETVRSVAYSPDGVALASASEDGTVRLWNLTTGRSLRVLEGHAAPVISVAYSPDGATLASASGDHTVRLWDVATGRTLRVLEGHTGEVTSVAYSPDGALASGSEDGTVRLWDPSTGETQQLLEGHTEAVRGIAYSPDGAALASASDDGAVRLWDVATGQLVRVLEGHTGEVNCVAYSPDGKTLASGSWDGTVRLRDALTGETLHVLEGHRDGVWTVAYSPDGRRLATGSDDGTLRLWRMPDKPLAQP